MRKLQEIFKSTKEIDVAKGILHDLFEEPFLDGNDSPYVPFEPISIATVDAPTIHSVHSERKILLNLVEEGWLIMSSNYPHYNIRISKDYKRFLEYIKYSTPTKDKT